MYDDGYIAYYPLHSYAVHWYQDGATYFVTFRLSVEENVYVSALNYKLNNSGMLSQLIAYAVTALGALGLGKKYMQKITDSQMTKKATKNGKRPPKDVLRRNTVLDEVSWTKKMKRRVSYVEPENTSIDVPSEETGLELTNMMTNPMDKSKASKPIGRRRRSSAPSAFEAAPPAPRRRREVVGASRADESNSKGIDKQQREINQQQQRQINELKQQVVELMELVASRSVNTIVEENQDGTINKKRLSFRKLETEDGTAYYANEESGDTVWTLPEGADVVE